MAEILKIGRVHNKELLTNPKDPTVSKLHLQLFIDDDYNVFVTDLNSSNGTYVNNNRLTKAQLLEEGDMLSAGNCIVKWGKYIDSLKNQETKIDDEADEDIEKDDEPITVKDEQYDLFKFDDEYIDGGVFIKRFLIGAIIPIIGWYVCASTSFKRANSLEYSTPSFYAFIGAFAPLFAFLAITVPQPVLLIIDVIFITLLCFRNGKRPSVLEKNLNKEIDLIKAENIVNDDNWSREDILAFYVTLTEVAGSDGVDPNEESIIVSFLTAIGFNPENNHDFEVFRRDASKIEKEKRYEILNSFSESKKQLLACAIKKVKLADGKVTSDENLAEGLIKILANLPDCKIDEDDVNYFKNLKK